MKASDLQVGDLMIGDWVYIKDYPTIAQPMQVKKEHFVRSLVEFEPIPLTPEILEKNGILYEKPSFYYIIKDDKDLECTYYLYQTIQEDWAIGVDRGVYDCLIFAIIKYIHELQHALKLCGIEKEIIV